MIDVRRASFRYAPGLAPALLEISVRVEPGEVVGIVGPNGSGKSTLGRLMKGLLLPSQGQVLVDGLDSAVDGIEVRRRVGLVFQNPNSQIVNSVVEQEVAFGPENLGLPAAEIRARVARALQAVSLVGREAMECHSLSMADKQRVALASVMAMQPRYLVLDESTTWLEPKARAAVLREVMTWAARDQVALVLVTHRMDEAQLCGRLYGMLHGQVEVAGTPAEILHVPEVRARLSLALPAAYVLTSELQAAGLPVTAGEPIDEVAERLCGS
jgi:energy-coupling factor transport system ATP-binding protein